VFGNGISSAGLAADDMHTRRRSGQLSRRAKGQVVSDAGRP